MHGHAVPKTWITLLEWYVFICFGGFPAISVRSLSDETVLCSCSLFALYAPFVGHRQARRSTCVPLQYSEIDGVLLSRIRQSWT